MVYALRLYFTITVVMNTDSVEGGVMLGDLKYAGPLTFLSAARLALMIASREVLVGRCSPRTWHMVALDEDRAVQQADRADSDLSAGRLMGPLRRLIPDLGG